MAMRCPSILSFTLHNLRLIETLSSSCRIFRPYITTATSLQRSPDLSSSEIEAADPFLSKLQKQTEAGYLELLARKDEVPDTEDDKLAEEELEASKERSNSERCSLTRLVVLQRELVIARRSPFCFGQHRQH